MVCDLIKTYRCGFKYAAPYLATVYSIRGRLSSEKICRSKRKEMNLFR